MEFGNNKPIYLQISDSLCEKILSGELKPQSRISSVRELGAEIGVNPNTIMRTYEKLTDAGIIYNKRGIGYFITDDAADIILQVEKRKFLEQELPAVLKKMKLLGIDPSEALEMNNQ